VRYYSIIISDTATTDILVPNLNGKPGFSRVSRLSGLSTYTSLIGQNPSAFGSTFAGAQNIEFDIPVAALNTPVGGAYVRVWGISLQEIAQANNLNNLSIKIYGGMAKGLPLANPSQSGLLLEGSIQQAFGNWQDVNMTLDMVINASYGTATQPANIILNWKKGQQFSSAIDSALAIAFPQYKRNININTNLVLTEDAEPGYFQTVSQFAQYVKQKSQSILGADYQGVDILLTQNTFNVYDGSTQTNPKQILFTDLIGQPTWINPGQIHVETVLRADLNVGDYVKLPRTPLITTAGALSQYAQIKQGSAFQGTFMIDYIRHVGNYRQPTGTSWITTFDMHQVA
jgi:hypothetical protein